MALLIAIIVFIFILCVIVVAHEVGHFLVARLAGVTVEEFGVGFPPRLASWKRGETEYSLNAVPLGGFVRLMDESGESTSTVRAGSFAQAKTLRKVSILLAGVSANVILAFVLFFLLFVVGTPGTISPQMPPGAIISQQRLEIVEVQSNSPAAKAGIEPGDTLLSAAGLPLRSAEDLDYAKSTSANLEIDVLRQGTKQTVSVKRSTADELLGTGYVSVANIRYPLFTAFAEAGKTTGALLIEIFRGIGRLFSGLFMRGQVSAELTGVVGIAVMTKSVLHLGPAALAHFTALLSLNLAVINLLPIPALDGGRLVMVLWEALRRKKITVVAAERLTSWSFVGLIVLMLLVTYRDIVRIAQGIIG